jgi:D-serine deaminase-like pyridoxal phosphate-dependent protein
MHFLADRMQVRQDGGVRDTPYTRVDIAVLEQNLAAMADRARARRVALRPHAKTHKSPDIAARQLAHGAVGLTVATVAEAEVFAAHGFHDLFIAYPLWFEGPRAARVAALLARGVRLRVGIDSVDGVGMLEAATTDSDRSRLTVAVEVDSGHHRSGVDPARAGVLARAATHLGLEVAGVFTYPGHSYAPDGMHKAAGDEQRALRVARDALIVEGLACPVGSGGSTPTTASDAVAGGETESDDVLTELRPGVYALGDAQQWELGAVAPASIALSVVATVVSRRVDDDGAVRLIVDAGSKALASDRPDWASGFGRCVEHPDARIIALSEHHATMLFSGGHPTPALGTRLRIVPNHVCTAVNLVDDLIAVDDDGAEEVWPVAARGANT